MIAWRPKTTPRELLLARWRIAQLLPRAGGRLVAAMVTIDFVAGALPVVFVIATSIVIGRVPAAVKGGLHSAAWRDLVTVFLFAAGAFVAQQILTPAGTALGELVARRVDGRAYDELMAASLGTPGIAPLEDQEALDQLQAAVNTLEFGIRSPGQACAGLVALIVRYTALIGYLVVVAVAFSWLAALALLAVVMLFRYGQRGGIRKYTAMFFEVGMSGRWREAEYLRRLAIETPAAKEIRVFGIVDWIRERLRGVRLASIERVWAERRRVYLWPFLWFALFGLLVAGVIFGAIGADGVHGITLTKFALGMQASLGAMRLGEYYSEADLQTATGMRANDAIQAFAARIATVAEQTPVRPNGASAPAVPDPLQTIHFDGVSFAYPGQQRLIFDQLDLTIPVGRCTAIVGVNGAGKTTLVKLLARLYEPTAGAVRADGVDIRDYSIDQWRGKLGVIFQDYARYEVSAADNIALGAVDFIDDRGGVEAAAEAVGLAATLDELPRGLDTPLARHLAGGADLSGGQWQRVALARALFAQRHGSPIVVLDEPTASLDVRAEASFFDEFAGLTQGATTLLISHRFSTVRRADLIVVLADGQVAEQGSHDALLARNGRYAELFRLQADRFTDELIA
ncbi:MAG: ABC transporter ATP-binding protein [Solirubrobacteraceae bacterium]